MRANDLYTSSAVGERQDEVTTEQPYGGAGPLSREMPDSARIALGLPPKYPKSFTNRYSPTPYALRNPQESKLITLGELLEGPTSEVPQLVSPFLQRKGLAMLAGSSDTGKSAFLRELALAVAMGEPDFLGFPIHPTHKRAICVCTEDNDDALRPLLEKQLRGKTMPEEAKRRLSFLLDTDDLVMRLDRELTKTPVDLIIIDALADIFEGNLNQSNEVRRFLQHYSALANKHGCLILFMHHTGKRAEERSPSKDNLLGSQGLEAKMRVVFELRADPYERDIRHLCVLKGNYLGPEMKEKSYALRLDENLQFHNTGRHEEFADLVKAPEQNANERELWKAAKELLEAGNSYDKTEKLLVPIAKKLGVISISRSKLHRRLPKPELSMASLSQNLSDDIIETPTADVALCARSSDFTDDAVNCLFVSGSILTTEQLLSALQVQHSGDSEELLAQLKSEYRIEPAPSDKACWRIKPTLM